jgi:hypothetical protein
LKETREEYWGPIAMLRHFMIENPVGQFVDNLCVSNESMSLRAEEERNNVSFLQLRVASLLIVFCFLRRKEIGTIRVCNWFEMDDYKYLVEYSHYKWNGNNFTAFYAFYLSDENMNLPWLMKCLKGKTIHYMDISLDKPPPPPPELDFLFMDVVKRKPLTTPHIASLLKSQLKVFGKGEFNRYSFKYVGMRFRIERNVDAMYVEKIARYKRRSLVTRIYVKAPSRWAALKLLVDATEGLISEIKQGSSIEMMEVKRKLENKRR